MKNNRGFTLIEMLVVISILALLAGMLMPVVSIARKKSGESNTMALLKKVDVALNKFSMEVETYPYLKHNATGAFSGAGNNLARILATNLTSTEFGQLNADLTVAREAYRSGGVHYVQATDINPDVVEFESAEDDGLGKAVREFRAGHINRLATERATLAVLAGNVTIEGISNNPSTAVVSTPQSSGYQFDYLSSDLNANERTGDDLVDFWQRPLVYNCPVQQGVSGYYPQQPINAQKSRLILEDTRNQIPVIDAEYYSLQTTGRSIVSSLNSDQRIEASVAYWDKYELWSAGIDGLIDPMRDNRSVNRDNLSPVDYLKGLQ